MNSETKAYIYAGETAHIAGHGTVNTGDTVFLNKSEQEYVVHDDAFIPCDHPDFEALKAKLAKPESEEESEPDAPPPISEEEIRKEIKKKYPKKDDLIAHAVSLGIEVEGQPKNEELVDMIVARIMKE